MSPRLDLDLRSSSCLFALVWKVPPRLCLAFYHSTLSLDYVPSAQFIGILFCIFVGDKELSDKINIINGINIRISRWENKKQIINKLIEVKQLRCIHNEGINTIVNNHSTASLSHIIWITHNPWTSSTCGLFSFRHRDTHVQFQLLLLLERPDVMIMF